MRFQSNLDAVIGNMIEESPKNQVDFGFMQICYGLILASFDFRFNGINLIPDFLGFIFIVVGLTKIESLHTKFKTAQLPAASLIPLSLPDIIEFTGDYNPLCHYPF